MKEMKMLDLERIDLPELCGALENHSEMSWWLDPRTGELHVQNDGTWDGEDVDEDFEPAQAYRRVEAVDSRESYRDMEDFAASVREPRARDLLQRAIAGRGAFRRFKDTLLQFPDLRAAWFRLHDLRMQRRAIEWLRDEALLEHAAAERALAARADPESPELSGPFDAEAIARAVASDLRRLYGERLRNVLLYGSWARGDARTDSDIDLLVVLDRVDDRWTERTHMSDVLYRHSLENDTLVSVLPVSETDFARPTQQVIRNARAEGVAVA